MKMWNFLRFFGEGDGSAQAASGAENTAASGESDTRTETPESEQQQGGTDGLAHRERDVNADDAFEALIKGEYREAYDRRVKKAVERRFKRARAAEDSLAKLTPAIEQLAGRFGLDPDDTDGLCAALARRSDEEDAAAEHKEALRAQREKQFDSWMRQSRALQAVLPDFDFGAEIRENPLFGKMLCAGVPVNEAYRALHFENLVNRVGERQARKAGLAVVNSVRANGMRPVENGLNAQPATGIRTDINALSPEQINELFERAGRGERITFRQ